MTKIQYVTEEGKSYSAEFIANRCNLLFSDKGKEIYEYFKQGKRCEIKVERREVSSNTLDLPYGFSYVDELENLEV